MSIPKKPDIHLEVELTGFFHVLTYEIHYGMRQTHFIETIL